MTKRFEWIAVLAVFLLAAGLRLGWVGVNSFAFDEANLSLIALDTARGGHFATVGMPSSAGVPNLPAAAWIFAIPYLFSTDPMLATAFVGVLSLLAVVGVWWLARSHWGMWAGLAAALYMAAAPFSVLFSRNIWSQNLLPIMGVLWLLTGVGAQSESRRWRFVSIAGNVFLAGFAFQVHFAGVALILGTAYLFFRLRWWREWLPLLVGGGLAVIALLPFALVALQPDSPVFSSFSQVMGGTSEVDIQGFRKVYQVALEWDWPKYILGQDQDIFNKAWDTVPISGALMAVGALTLLRTIIRRQPAPPSLLVELMAVLLVSVPVVFIRHSTPVYLHYQLTALPALALIVGAGTGLLRPRWWAWLVTGVMAILAGIWAAQLMISLDMAGRIQTPRGLGTPLGILRSVAYDLPEDRPVVFLAHGDNPRVDGEPAIFGVFWWGLPNRIINGESVLILPPEPTYLLATIESLQAWEEIESLGLDQDVVTINRREGRQPFVATLYDGQQAVSAFTPLTPIPFDDGTQLEGWRVRWMWGNRLRVSTLWRVTDPTGSGGYHQFHHLRDAEASDPDAPPFQISDVPLSSSNWQAGDLLIVMADFQIEADSTGTFSIDVGHYQLEDGTRSSRRDGQGTLVRLGPFDLADVPNSR